jgi:hypothetical protein
MIAYGSCFLCCDAIRGFNGKRVVSERVSLAYQCWADSCDVEDIYVLRLVAVMHVEFCFDIRA